MAKGLGPDRISSYRKPGRLGEVLALIQVLAYDKDTSRSEEGLQDELQNKPSTASSWLKLAESHPEFFRVRQKKDRTKRAALVARYVLEYEELESGEEKRPSLTSDVVNKLMEIAIELHDRQQRRAERWRVLIPIGGAVIGAAATVIVAAIKVMLDAG